MGLMKNLALQNQDKYNREPIVPFGSIPLPKALRREKPELYLAKHKIYSHVWFGIAIKDTQICELKCSVAPDSLIFRLRLEPNFSRKDLDNLFIFVSSKKLANEYNFNMADPLSNYFQARVDWLAETFIWLEEKTIEP